MTGTVADILFRLLGSDDGLSSVTTNANKNVKELQGNVDKSTQSFSQMETSAKKAGLSAQQVGEAKAQVGGLGTSVDTTKGKVDKLRDSFSAVKVAAGLALTGAGMYLEQFVKSCVSASVSVQQSMLAIGGSMGLSATQSLAQGPAIDNMADNVSGDTGQNAEDIKKILPSVQAVAGKNLGDDQTSLEAISNIAWAKQGTGMTLSSAADKYNKMVTTGSGMALGDIGLTLGDMGLTGTQFQQMTPAQRKQVMDSAIQKKEGGENAAMKNSTIGKENQFEAAETKFEAKIGDTFMPMMTSLMSKLTWAMDKMPKNKYFLDALGGIILLTTGLALIGGPLLMLYPVLAKVGGGFKSLGGKIKSLLGIGKNGKGGANSISSKVCDCMKKGSNSCSTNSGGNNSNSKGKRGNKYKSGVSDLKNEGKGASKWGRIKGFLSDSSILGDEGGSFMGGFRGIGGVGTKLGGIGSKLGGVGRLAGMGGMLGVDSIPLLGEAVMAGTAVAGGVGGWQATKGNWGDKSKGAVGGAVEALSMGMINRQQVVGGINWIGDKTKGLPKQIGKDLGNVGNIITSPFKSAFNKGKQIVGAGWNLVSGIFTKGVNTDKAILGTLEKGATVIWNDITGVFKTARKDLGKVWTDITGDVSKELTNIENTVVNAGKDFYKDATNLGGQIWNGLKKGLGINSPGFMYHTMVGEFKNIHGAMDSYQSILGKKSGDMGNHISDKFKPIGSVPNRNAGANSGYKAIHYHAPITIDASHMTAQELKALIIEVNEKSMKPAAIPTPATSSSASTGISASTLASTASTAGGS